MSRHSETKIVDTWRGERIGVASEAVRYICTEQHEHDTVQIHLALLDSEGHTAVVSLFPGEVAELIANISNVMAELEGELPDVGPQPAYDFEAFEAEVRGDETE